MRIMKYANTKIISSLHTLMKTLNLGRDHLLNTEIMIVASGTELPFHTVDL